MVRRSNFASLNCESLEAREVPAIILDAMVNAGMTDAPPNGGTVTITELQLANTTALFDRTGNTVTGQTKDTNASDNITFSLNGTNLSISASDGIFGRVTNFAGNPIVFYGTTLDIQNVTGLNVNLQLGGGDSVTLNGTASYSLTVNTGLGNDTINDNTGLTATLNGGDGDDTIKAMGNGMINPLLLMGLGGMGGFNPLLFGGGMGGQKTIQGGAGTDNLTGPLFGFFNMLDGGDGNDTIIGGLGPDFITGGNGFDILFGFGGNDFYIAFDFGPDFIFRQPGDTVFGDPFDM